MNSEIFRFVTLRPPQIQDQKDPRLIKIPLKPAGSYDPFFETLKRAKEESSRKRMVELAKEYVAKPDFISSPEKVDGKYYQLAVAVREHADQPIKDYFKEEYEKIFSDQAEAVVQSPEFKKTYERVSYSLIVSIILSNLPPPTNSFVVSVLYVLYLIEQLATNYPATKRIIDAKIILPSEIFPLPEVEQSLSEHRKKMRERQKSAGEELRKKTETSVKIIRDNENAIKEIIHTFEKTEPNIGSKQRGFILSRETVAHLTPGTKRVLQEQGFSDGEIDVAKSVNFLEQANASAASDLYSQMDQGTTMVRIGSSLVPNYAITPSAVEPISDSERITPGVCPLTGIGGFSEVDDLVTVPKVNGGKRNPLIADLMLVEQELSRYEMGEIAHIENVLKSEIRERKFRTSRMKEESLMVETEETEEKQKDLTTADRYELQNESQNVINENASRQAGVTISTDGPTVDATASYNYSASGSRQQSHSMSSNYARETTSTAKSRIEKRKLERRFTRTVEETEEINRHRFDNTTGPDHITGVYRWIDKIYEAQIVNYGKKLMLEFMVPEPAAFLRYAAAQLPNGEETAILKPDHPGSCMSDGKTFQPLRVEDIQPSTYLFWVAKYNVEDVSPPPPVLIVVSEELVNKGGEGEMRLVKYHDPQNVTVTTSITTAEEGEVTTTTTADGEVTTTSTPTTPPQILKTWVGAGSKPITIPDGYIPYEAYINMKGLQGLPHPTLTVQIQDKEVSNQSIGGGGKIWLANTPTSSIPFTVESFGFVLYEIIVNVYCTRSTEKFQDWQLSTYRAIMNAYNDKKSRYDSAIEAAKIRSGLNPIQGKNPLANREIEKIELKKGCIALLTGQRFNDFDAVNMNVAPHGFPEVDFVEAKAEEEYIKFFEQAFEWSNITYIFYPYFWSNKKEWLMLSKLDDPDPLYTRFLQAGSARVNVPIRVGFESAVLSFISGAQIWNAEGEFMVDDHIDPEYLSIAEEFRSQSGGNSVNGKGTLNVQKNSSDVSGIDTEFTRGDENKRIIIKGQTYVIKKVQSATKIILKTKYLGQDEGDVEFSLGGLLIGQPWEIRLPTNLVKIDPNYVVM